MANTTFSTLKTTALSLFGNNLNANDSLKLELVGSCINQALSIIQGEIKGHPFTLDINNTVSSTTTTPYKTDLADTNIIEILQVSQRSDPRKMTWIPYTQYMEYMADPTRLSGTPSWYWTAIQNLNGSGQNIWSLFFIPTPASAITIYYDYVKNLQFSANGTSANAEYSPLPTTFDAWIYAEAKPIFYEIIMPEANAVIQRASAQALEARQRFKSMILSPADGYQQVQSRRQYSPYYYSQVGQVSAP